jgi:MFS family permease
MAILGVARPVWLYTLIRFVQVLCIAPVFPLVVGRIAQHAGGDIIGIVNSARIAAAFVGPVLATSLLAWTSAPIVYLAMAALGVACLPLVALPSPADRGHRPSGRRRALGRP